MTTLDARPVLPDPDRGPVPDLDDLVTVVAGDEIAFARLYDATAARVHGIVLRVLRNPAQADEVTQEVFLEVWRTAPRFDPERGSALAWLMTIAHHRAVQRVRSAEAAGRRDLSFHRQHRPVDHDATSDAVTSSLEAAHVRAALACLTALQHEAVRLAYFDGYTYTEVAAILDVPTNTVKTRIRDGLIRLRTALVSQELDPSTEPDG